MRRRIRLTGRRQIPQSTVRVEVTDNNERKMVALIAQPGHENYFNRFPGSARFKLRLAENKISETLEFGTVGKPKTMAELKNEVFSAPSCQLRVVASDGDERGKLLGSTSRWTLRADDSAEALTGDTGILLFQQFDIAPRVWKLDIRDDEYPIVYIDKAIPNSAKWAKNDPIFVSCVLPSIVQQIFFDILLRNATRPDVKWMKDWITWSQTLVPGKEPPFSEDFSTRQSWIDDVLIAFSKRHRLDEMLANHLKPEEDQ